MYYLYYINWVKKKMDNYKYKTLKRLSNLFFIKMNSLMSNL